MRTRQYNISRKLNLYFIATHDNVHSVYEGRLLK